MSQPCELQHRYPRAVRLREQIGRHPRCLDVDLLATRFARHVAHANRRLDAATSVAERGREQRIVLVGHRHAGEEVFVDGGQAAVGPAADARRPLQDQRHARSQGQAEPAIAAVEP